MSVCRVRFIAILAVIAFLVPVLHAQTVTVAPSALNFGSVNIGGETPSQVVTVSNSSGAAVGIGDKMASAGFVVSYDFCGSLLAAGASCQVYVRFRPQVVTNQGTLTITTQSGNLTVSLSGTGMPHVDLTPTSLSFPDTNIGQGSSSQVVNLMNRTGADLTLSSETVSAGFVVSYNFCGSSLTNGSNCLVYVRFNPQVVVSQGTLTIVDSFGTQTVALSGTGIGHLTTSVSALNFGAVNVGSNSTLQAFYVYNQTGAALPFTVSLPADYLLHLSTCGTTIPLGGTCQLYVRFIPQGAGQRDGTLAINSSFAPVSINLSGFGIGPLSIPAVSLPGGMVGAHYSTTLSASGGLPGYSWTVIQDSLPANLTLDTASGLISGTPTEAGTWSFTVQVSDSQAAPHTATQTFSIGIAEALAITTAALPDGVVDSPYAVTLQATGGVTPYNWSAVPPGSLPAGLTLDSTTGVLSATPTGAWDGNVTVRLTDQQGYWVDRVYAMKVHPRLVVTGLSPTAGVVGGMVTITGSGFGSAPGTVIFGGNVTAVVAVENWSDSLITVFVPKGAQTGPITVRAAGQQAGAELFEVQKSLLRLSVEDSPGQVNLGDPLNLDWVLWGADGSSTAPTRKAGTPQIGELSIVGTESLLVDLYGSIRFSWTGGTPTENGSDLAPRVLVSDSNSGFRITVAADTTPRTLKLYAGIHGNSRLEASLSDGSSPAIHDESIAAGGETDKTFCIDFRAASAGQTLTVALLSTSEADGYVTLPAVALQPLLPAVAVTLPQDGQVMVAGNDLALGVTADQVESSLASVAVSGDSSELHNWTAPPYATTWPAVPAGHHQLLAQATDAAGLTGVSKAVEFDAVATGGALTVSLGQIDPEATVNLTAEAVTEAGPGDWRLFVAGATGGGGENADPWKVGVASLISPYRVLGNRLESMTMTGGPTAYAFTDGVPVTEQFDVRPYAGVDGLGNGFELAIHADTTPRMLRLYAGVGYGRARLQVFLSDGSAAPVVDSALDNPGDAQPAVYVVNYHAATGNQTLTVRLTLDREYGCGVIKLQAATLTGPNPIAVTEVSPATGPVGAKVTITGAGFGTAPGGVSLGAAAMDILTWSDEKIEARVPAGAVDGPLTIQTGTLTASGPVFTVTELAYAISPSSVSMMAGDTRTFAATTSNGEAVTGLAWTTSAPTVLSLSADDPPVITALAAGEATVYAGSQQAQVTVYDPAAGGALPPGTPIWTVALGGSENLGLIPAIPTADSDTEVYAIDDSRNLNAISGDGKILWSMPLPGYGVVPDFDGNLFLRTSHSRTQELNCGLPVPPPGCPVPAASANRSLRAATLPVSETCYYEAVGGIDGKTRQPTWSYEFPVVHEDGYCTDRTGYRMNPVIPHPAGVVFIQNLFGVVVIDTHTGQTLGAPEFEMSNYWGNQKPATVGKMIVAGDGNAYVPYVHADRGNSSVNSKLRVLRVSPDGTWTKIFVQDLTYDCTGVTGDPDACGTAYDYYYDPGGPSLEETLSFHPLSVMTNADHGVLLFAPPPKGGWSNRPGSVFTIAGDAVTAHYEVDWFQGYSASFLPELQREDGSVVGFMCPALTSGAYCHMGAVRMDEGHQGEWQPFPRAPHSDNLEVLKYATAKPACDLPDPAACNVDETLNGGVILSYLVPDPNAPPVLPPGYEQQYMLRRLDKDGNTVCEAPDVGGKITWTGKWMIPSANLATAAANMDALHCVLTGDTDAATASTAFTMAGDMSAHGVLENTLDIPGVTGDLAFLGALSVPLADSWWGIWGGNASGTGKAEEQNPFPLLDSCTRPVGGHTPQCPAAGDAVWNAKNDIIGQLTLDQPCANAAQTKVFNRLSTVTGAPANTKTFVDYLKTQPGFYNGLKSTYSYKDVLCPTFEWNCGTAIKTVKAYFEDDTTATAITIPGSVLFTSFWRQAYTPPNLTAKPPEEFGVGINLERSGKNIENESSVFHEALHGLTGLKDEKLKPLFCIPPYPNGSECISVYIKHNVLMNCQSFR